jgi:hypothetical protein
MVLLVLSIEFLQNLMDLLAGVLNLLNEFGALVDHKLIMGRFGLWCGKWKCNINGSQGLESQTHLKWAMVSEAMESHVVIVMNIGETLVPCMWMLRIVREKDVHNQPIDDLCLDVGLGVECNGFCDLGVQQKQETEPKCVEEPFVPVKYDGLWYPKVDPHSFEKYLGSICQYDIILAGCEDGHPWKLINDHKYAIISLLGGWEARHVIHWDGFARLLRNRKRGV